MKPRLPSVLASVVLAALFVGFNAHADKDSKKTDIPKYVVDPYWPKPLPNRWVTGEVGGICVDSSDHVFGINRRNINALETTVGKLPAPPVIEYDEDGNIVRAWGDPNVLPLAIHGCFVDAQDNLWIAGSGGGMVQKWSHDGSTLLLQIGNRTVCDGPGGACGAPGLNSSTGTLNDPADIAVDPQNGDVYIADGYGNYRVVVFDSKGKYLRQWGSPGTGPGQFQPNGGGHPHCVVMGKDGLLYVCDRGNDRVQIFDKQGNLVKIISVKPGTGYVPAPDGTPGRRAVGSVLDVDFSVDRLQKYMFTADTGNEVLWIFDRAKAVNLGGFGSQGHNAGNWTLLHMLAVDSKGRLYTSETVDGRRLQRFLADGFVRQSELGTYMGSPHYEPFPRNSSGKTADDDDD